MSALDHLHAEASRAAATPHAPGDQDLLRAAATHWAELVDRLGLRNPPALHWEDYPASRTLARAAVATLDPTHFVCLLDEFTHGITPHLWLVAPCTAGHWAFIPLDMANPADFARVTGTRVHACTDALCEDTLPWVDRPGS